MDRDADYDVVATHDPAVALELVSAVLERDPTGNCFLVGLLRGRSASGVPGRYWVARAAGEAAGIAVQTPPGGIARISAMPRALAQLCAEAMLAEGVMVAGIDGAPEVALAFAGHWAESTKQAVVPVIGERVYEITRVEEQPVGVPGAMRTATDADTDVLMRWVAGFGADTATSFGALRSDGVGGGSARDSAEARERRAWSVRERVKRGEYQLWVVDDQPVSMAARTQPAAGTSIVQLVYTPPERRLSGYATACVAAISARILADGVRCILYTDLGNPTSNSVYRRIGYDAIGETIRLRFR